MAQFLIMKRADEIIIISNENVLNNYRNALATIKENVDKGISEAAGLGLYSTKVNVGKVFSSYEISALWKMTDICREVADEVTSYGYDVQFLYGKTPASVNDSYLMITW